MDMHVVSDSGLGPDEAVRVYEPVEQTAPIVFASPHSGLNYPADFVEESRLDPLTLRKSEDSYIDEIFAAAPEHGAPMVAAQFPRAYVDPNREPFELDPEMFSDALPDYANVRSPRVAAGLGTIARVVCSGAEIYDRKISFADALTRINQYYRPYHDTLTRMIERTRDRFGFCILIDCHSMPSVGGPMDRDPGRRRVDFVLGDCHGTACAPALVERVERFLESRRYVVKRNLPYAGGYTTRHYGKPAEKIHALQIEVNRAIYMNEDTYERTKGMAGLTDNMSALVAMLTGADYQILAA